MAVVSGYHFTVTKAVIGLFLVLLVELVAVFVLHILGQRAAPNKVQVSSRLILTGLTIILLYISLFSPIAVRPANAMGWSWIAGMRSYGFNTCFIEDAMRMGKRFEEPQGYNTKEILVTAPENPIIIDNNPSIILILNETFYNLDSYTSVDADIGLLREFYSIENAVFGYAIVSNVGGGTNNSEYELLTSNSMYLLGRNAPFNYVPLAKTGNNIVQNMKVLGYFTAGMHCGGKSNYSRNNAYPKLGFDEILLGESAFQYVNKYGNRPWLDSDNYKDLMECYSRVDDGSDAFIYLLTLQNHGGYEQNPPENDTVHTQGDFGDLTDDINEYLTSIQMSAKAFAELTEYFSHVDRHVIICMVGDHAPAFINSLPAKREMSFEEAEIAKRAVPYVIWANYEVEFPEYTEYASMVDLVPMVLKTAGMPLTAYYQYILDMHDVLPVRTSTGIYMDRDGTIGAYEENSPYYDMMTQYYYMEYNALKAGVEYRKELFEYK